MAIRTNIILFVYCILLTSTMTFSQNDTICYNKVKYVWEYSMNQDGTVDSCLTDKFFYTSNETINYYYYNCGELLHCISKYKAGKIQYEEYYNNDGRIFAKYFYIYDSLNTLTKIKLISIEDTIKQAEQKIDNFYSNGKLNSRIFYDEFGKEVKSETYSYNDTGSLKVKTIRDTKLDREEIEFYEHDSIVRRINYIGRIQTWQYDSNNRLIEYHKDKYHKENYVYSDDGLLEKIIRYRKKGECFIEYEYDLFTYNSKGDIIKLTTRKKNSEDVTKYFWKYKNDCQK